MQEVLSYIDEKQARFAAHPFFARLKAGAPLSEILPCTDQVGFWTMAFQDALRINEERVADPTLRAIVQQHRVEESGHDRWFLEDMATITGSAPDVQTLFGDHHRAGREATYALIAEVMQDLSDAERVLVLFVFESTGHVFFDAIANYFPRVGITRSLKYFANHHLDAEADHEVFEEEMEKFIRGITLSPEQRIASRLMVDRAYAAFHVMLDGLEAQASALAAQGPLSPGALLEARLRLSEHRLEAAMNLDAVA
jgi:hypothetical protein